MRVLSFDYTKADKSVTKRVLIEQVQPSKFYEGTDVSEMSSEDQHAIAVLMSEARDKYLKEVAQILEDFDCNNSYRRFSMDKMSNITMEQVSHVD